MIQRIPLFLSIALTAFVLVIIGAVIERGRQVQAASVNPTLDPQLVAQLQARESEYRALIEQANAQLNSPDPTVNPTVAPVPTQEPTPTYSISPELAAYIALSAAPGSYLVKTPELVSFQGTVAYEVTLNSGRIYVGANNGQILSNGAVSNSGAGGSNFRAGGEQDDEDD
jgi:uncharacterized membrane protein YkoI